MQKLSKYLCLLMLSMMVLFLQKNEAHASTVYHEGDVITFTATEEIDRLYILWDTIPGEWILRVDGNEYRYGKYEFLHEYVEPGISGKVWEIEILTSEVKVGSVYTYEVGEELDDFVQIWEPPCEDADLMVFPTHADDELIFFGGTLPYYAGELDYDVQVVYLTNHWAKQPHRVHELLNGLWTCGVENYPIIGPFYDKYSKNNLEHAKTLYNLDDIRAFQVTMLRRFRPEVLIMQDVNGEYGHSVHMLNTVMMMESVELAADENYTTADAAGYKVWDVPKMYIHFWEENRIEIMWDMKLPKFDGKTALEVAKEAYQCHASQVSYNDIVTEPTAIGCTIFGLYRSRVGEDVLKNDFFENIVYHNEVEVPESRPSIFEEELGGEHSADTNDDIYMPPSEDDGNDHRAWWLIGVGLVCVMTGITIIIKNKRR